MRTSKNDFITTLETIDQGYLDIIGQEAFSVLVYLMFIKRSQKRDNIKPIELIERLNFTHDSLKKAVDILKTVNLMSANKQEDGSINFKIILKNKLNSREKEYLITLLSQKNLIDSSRATFLKDLFIKKDVEKTVKTNTIVDKAEDVDILTVRVKAEPNPDTGIGLVRFFYRILNEKFQTQFGSRNEQKEAKIIKDAMKKFGDTPDITRKIMAKIIERHSRSGDMDRISTLNLYHSERNAAYFDLFGERQDKFVKEFKPDFDKALSQAKNIYVYFKSKGEDLEFIFNNRIKPVLNNMSEEDVEKIKISLEG